MTDAKIPEIPSWVFTEYEKEDYINLPCSVISQEDVKTSFELKDGTILIQEL